MRQALSVTFVLAVLVAPAVQAQDAPVPDVSSLEVALGLPVTPATREVAPSETPSCLPDLQQPLEQGGHCEDQCLREYDECVVFCSKNPCFVACETVLEICLSNCH